MSARLQDIESQHGPAEEQELSWADRMDRVSPLPDDASVHTFQGEDDQEEDDKENAPTGTKLFPVGDKTETFLKTCFAGKTELDDNGGTNTGLPTQRCLPALVWTNC